MICRLRSSCEIADEIRPKDRFVMCKRKRASVPIRVKGMAWFKWTVERTRVQCWVIYSQRDFWDLIIKKEKEYFSEQTEPVKCFQMRAEVSAKTSDIA